MPPDPQILEDLFQSWKDKDDEQEQKETWEYLRQVLDEDRLSNRSRLPLTFQPTCQIIDRLKSEKRDRQFL